MLTNIIHLKKRPKIVICICIAVTLANISYYPYLNSVFSIDDIVKCIWLFLFLILIVKDNKINSVLNKYIYCIITFDFFILLGTLLFNSNYLTSRLFLPINMTLFFLMTGCLVAKYLNKLYLRDILRVYIISTMLILVLTYFKYYYGVNWLGSLETIVVQKNSLATLAIFSTVILLFNPNMFKKNLKYIFLIISTLMIFVLKSRTIIISFFIVLIYFWFKLSKKKKLYIFFTTILIILFISYYTHLFDVLLNNILLNNRSLDFNTLTSGRVSHLEIFIKLFKNNSLIGTGGTYLESMPLALFLSYGFIGSFPIIILLTFSIKDIFFRRSAFYDRNFDHLIIALFLILIFNGLAEELAPFGPGVKCFMLWFLLGIKLNKTYYLNKGEI